ncbi:MAG: GNAT family N-acetyltransferase [Acidimicrobiia bacterium]
MNQPLPRHDEENDRYVIEVDGDVAGYAEYHLRGKSHYFFHHTVTEDDYRGKGVGSQLARFAMDDVRAKGGQVVPLCPFIAAWLDKHPDYQDLIDTVIMDRIAKRSHDET